ncbi:MAG: DUF2817 domain-containing protein [Spirochaetia bacterium]|nr:DUF2817 domain-containing protein [Spirochaetia bacterium]
MSENNEIKESKKFKNYEDAVFEGGGWFILGHSAGQNKIMAKELRAENSRKKVLLLGGVHGNETEGVQFMVDFCREFAKDEEKSPFGFDLFLVPVLNPDGFFAHERKNASGVDLNRNMPTKDWSPEFQEDKYNPGSHAGSEPESKILVDLLNKHYFDFIISFHSWKPMININGPAEIFGEKMKEKLKMKVVKDIGYPTPGSLGTYAGWERGIPTITLEFERGVELEGIYAYARDAILDSFKALQSE